MIEVKRSEMAAKLQQQKETGKSQNVSGNDNKINPREPVATGDHPVVHHKHHFVREINSHNFNHVVINSNKVKMLIKIYPGKPYQLDTMLVLDCRRPLLLSSMCLLQFALAASANHLENAAASTVARVRSHRWR